MGRRGIHIFEKIMVGAIGAKSNICWCLGKSWPKKVAKIAISCHFCSKLFFSNFLLKNSWQTKKVASPKMRRGYGKLPKRMWRGGCISAPLPMYNSKIQTQSCIYRHIKKWKFWDILNFDHFLVDHCCQTLFRTESKIFP